ncbi:PF07252 domain protein [Staphylococcus epidermidis VCU118]|nr:PF07252 domain protein [Staphylococcus epidermidis VCU118]
MNKKVILIFSILISIGLIVGVFYLKVKNDKEKEIKQQYYDEQKQRITLYMKYNVKNIRKLLLQMLKRIL